MADEAPPPAPPPAAPPSTPWYHGIDGETIGHWENKGWNKDDPKALATELTKAWKGLERHFGAPPDQILKLPKDANDEAGWRAVRERLGAPKDAKEYDFSTVKFSDGSDVEDSFAETLRSAFHKHGLSKDAATDIVKSVVKRMDDADSAEATAFASKKATQIEKLRREWGDHFEYNELQALNGAKRLGVSQEEYDSIAKVLGYDRAPEFFRRIGSGLSEGEFTGGAAASQPTTVNGARARLSSLLSDPDYSRRYLSGSRAEVDEISQLQQMIHGIAA